MASLVLKSNTDKKKRGASVLKTAADYLAQVWPTIQPVTLAAGPGYDVHIEMYDVDNACFSSAHELTPNGRNIVKVIMASACLNTNAGTPSTTIRGGATLSLGNSLQNLAKSCDKCTGQECLWLAGLIHEVGHCIQMIISPPAYVCGREQYQAEFNHNKFGARTQKQADDFSDFCRVTISAYAAGKPAVMDIFPETLVSKAFGFTIHPTVETMWESLGGFPVTAFTNKCNIPIGVPNSKTIDEIRDSANPTQIISECVQYGSNLIAAAFVDDNAASVIPPPPKPKKTVQKILIEKKAKM